MAEEKPAEEAKKEEAASGGGGIKAMLPLIITIVLMPVMAFVMTHFLLLPKIQSAITASAKSTGHAEDEEGEAEPEAAESAHGKPAEGGHGEEAPKKIPGGAKAKYTLSKIIVNLRDSLGTRYLMSSYTLVGKGEEFINLCTANEDQLRDVAMNVLGSKTIQDLEKLDSKNLIRAELTSSFNTALGKPAVNEIYITEFAIQ